MSTDAKRAGNARHLEKLERVVFRLHKDGTDGFTKEQIEAAAQASGQSVNAWIIDAIKDKAAMSKALDSFYAVWGFAFIPVE